MTNLPRGVERPNDPAYQVEFVRGEGCYLWDSTGKRYLDFVSGYSSLSFGHSHPRLVAAAKEQLDTLVHLVGWNHPWRTQLAHRLVELSPFQEPAKAWISTTGARAVEIAWKVAVANRPGAIVSFTYAYHGRSIATSQITHTDKVIIPLPQSIEPIEPHSSPRTSLPVLPYATCEDCPLGLNRSTCSAECFDQSEEWLRTHAEGISAVIVEPALGARGYYFAANAFFHRLRKVTHDLGILLIDDEIQMGLGRLGSLFAASKQGWLPDLIVIGKSLGGGLVNVSAVIGPECLIDTLPPGLESETFAADPLGCRVALEVLDLFEEEIEPGLSALSDSLASGIQQLQQTLSSRCPTLKLHVDSQGCAAVIQIMSNSSYCDRSNAPSSHLAKTVLTLGLDSHSILAGKDHHESVAEGPQDSPASVAEAWVENACQSGLLVHWSGKSRDRLVLIPPLIVSSKMVFDAIDILASCRSKETRL